MTNASELLEGLVRRESESPDPPPQTADQVWHAIEAKLATGQPAPELDPGPLVGGGSGRALVLGLVGGGALAALIGLGLGAFGERETPRASRVEAPTPTTPDRAAAPAVAPTTDPAPIDAPTNEPVPEPVPIASPPSLSSPPRSSEADAAALERPPRRPRAAGPEPEPRAPKTLADEVALARRISGELDKAAWKRALKLVAEHERDFPAGQLVEERQAAKARALCHVGSGDAGRKEALAFAERWPTSIHLAVVRRDCEEN